MIVCLFNLVNKILPPRKVCEKRSKVGEIKLSSLVIDDEEHLSSTTIFVQLKEEEEVTLESFNFMLNLTFSL